MPHAPKKTDHPASKAWYWIDNFYNKQQEYFEKHNYEKHMPITKTILKNYLKTMREYFEEYKKMGEGKDYVPSLEEWQKELERQEDQYHQDFLTSTKMDNIKSIVHVLCMICGFMDEPAWEGAIL